MGGKLGPLTNHRRRGAYVPIGSPLRSTPPSEDECKLPARESFQRRR
jgi:hypothetical protein